MIAHRTTASGRAGALARFSELKACCADFSLTPDERWVKIDLKLEDLTRQATIRNAETQTVSGSPKRRGEARTRTER